MNNVFLKILFGLAAAFLWLSQAPANAQTRIEHLVLEAEDGEQVTGFLFQKHVSDDDAPLAILMHGMGGSSITWLAYDQSFYVDAITRDMIDRGYRVVALDARAHGARISDISPMDRLRSLRSGESGPYRSMINGTVEDYVKLLDHLDKRFGLPDRVVAIGYSMGAQTAILLSAQDDRVSHIVTMVPPAARSAIDVAPVTHAAKVSAQWLLITAAQDQFSTAEENAELVHAAGSQLTKVEFDSGHRLPRKYTAAVANWLDRSED
ncbi:hypothetical protein GCM10009096_02310 [Parasphingorhabdus litoris]|uniref:AB hydrolase-1 domain-containing protein n=1 Tax=Parasphingorhabdus litoris TaxID=394733 RepID=A0ABN1A1I2_9SPHN|nr:alpha/beta fold hydrolase [Parasphingorhabdus litoris]